MTDLDDIRAGRRDTGGVNTPANAAKARRISAEDNKRIRMGRMAKDFALPAFGLIVVVGLLLFMIFSNKGSDQKSVINDQDIAKTAVYGMYRTADGDKEVRLVSGNLALLVTAGSAVEVPYVLITSNWGDLFSALSSSVFQKQIWAEKKDLGLRTQDEIVYYANDGAESKVVAKMKHLAGYAQAYNLKRGEYPRYVNGNMLSEFAFVNPLDGRGSAIPIKTLLSQASDGLDAKGGLESGLEAGLAPNETPSSGNAPFSITCYAVLQGKPEDNLDQIRATKFFVRGCDRNGSFLSSGHPGRSYVVTAADNYLAAIPAGALGDLAARPSTTSRSKLSAKTKIRGKTKGPPKALPESSDSSKADDVQDQNKAAQAALPTVRTEQPDKSTKLWLILNPAYPMLLIHHALPLILLGLAILAYLRAKMVHVEATGPSISATSNAHSHYAKITAAVLLALAVLVIMAQFVIFA
jgi:hypothetical protein